MNGRPFIPVWFDDLDLSPVQHRVYSHLWRRADRNNKCWPSGPAIAKACHISKDSVWPAIRELEARRLLVRSNGFRRVNVYTLICRVGGNEGVTHAVQSAETAGLLSAESKGLLVGGKQGVLRFPIEGTPMKGEGAPTPKESDVAWIARLRAAWPSIDVDTQLRLAAKKKAKDGAQLERGWFETSWLPNCSPVVNPSDVLKASRSAVVPADPEPAGWRDVVRETQYGPGGAFEVSAWSELTEDVKTWAREQLRKSS